MALGVTHFKGNGTFTPTVTRPEGSTTDGLAGGQVCVYGRCLYGFVTCKLGEESKLWWWWWGGQPLGHTAQLAIQLACSYMHVHVVACTQAPLLASKPD